MSLNGWATGDDYLVSFDISLQSFKNGETAPGDPETAPRALEPHLAGSRSGLCTGVPTRDGEAAAYGVGRDALTFNHAGGEVIRQVMVDLAKAAD